MDELYGDFKTCIFGYHIFREGNRCVDRLVSFGIESHKMFLPLFHMNFVEINWATATYILLVGLVLTPLPPTFVFLFSYTCIKNAAYD